MFQDIEKPSSKVCSFTTQNLQKALVSDNTTKPGVVMTAQRLEKVVTNQQQEDPNGPLTPQAPGKFLLNKENLDTPADIFRLDVPSLVNLLQTIESQFSLEILLKHRELRLIDQEIAKCQIALEQLRRCQVIPYPAMSSRFEDMQSVSSGLGPVCEDKVSHPSPWGVTDGPYSRHYAQWLIPDPAFNARIAENTAPRISGKVVLDHRATRGSAAEKNYSSGHSPPQCGSAGARLHALPHGYPDLREDKGPMIIKRSTDGKMVKLVCLDCRRDNFNSVQGFINHCRIAHSRGFASHDAAAIASGEELGLDDAGTTIGDSNVINNAGTAAVHPLIKSANVAKSSKPLTPNPAFRQRKSTLKMNETRFPTASSVKPKLSKTGLQDFIDFTACPQTPYLSSFFAQTRQSVNLREMVSQAKIRSDIGILSDNEDGDLEHGGGVQKPPEALDPQSPLVQGDIHRGRVPAQAVVSSGPLEVSPIKEITHEIQESEPLPEYNQQPLYPAPYSIPSLATQHPQPAHSLVVNSPSLNFSPSNMESHPAPSLVSDDGDCENTHSESESPTSTDSDEEDHYLDIEVEEPDGPIGTLEGSTSAALSLDSPGKPQASSARCTSSLGPPVTVRAATVHSRHVSFVDAGRRAPMNEQRGAIRKNKK